MVMTMVGAMDNVVCAGCENERWVTAYQQDRGGRVRDHRDGTELVVK